MGNILRVVAALVLLYLTSHAVYADSVSKKLNESKFHFENQDFDKAYEYAIQAYSESEQIYSGWGISKDKTLTRLIYISMSANKFQDCVLHTNKLINLRRLKYREKNINIVSLYHTLGICYFRLHDYENAEIFYLKSSDYARSDVSLLSFYFEYSENIINFYSYTGIFSKGEIFIKKIEKDAVSHFGSKSLTMGQFYGIFSNFYDKYNLDDLAESYIMMQLEVAIENKTKQPLFYINTLNNVATFLDLKNKKDTSFSFYQEARRNAYSIKQDVNSKDAKIRKAVLSLNYNYAVHLYNSGKIESAIKEAENLISDISLYHVSKCWNSAECDERQTYVQETSGRAYALLCVCEAKKNNHAKGLVHCKKAEKFYDDLIGDGSLLHENLYSDIANVYMAINDYENALVYYKKLKKISLKRDSNISKPNHALYNVEVKYLINEKNYSSLVAELELYNNKNIQRLLRLADGNTGLALDELRSFCFIHSDMVQAIYRFNREDKFNTAFQAAQAGSISSVDIALTRYTIRSTVKKSFHSSWLRELQDTMRERSLLRDEIISMKTYDVNLLTKALSSIKKIDSKIESAEAKLPEANNYKMLGLLDQNDLRALLADDESLVLFYQARELHDVADASLFVFVLTKQGVFFHREGSLIPRSRNYISLFRCGFDPSRYLNIGVGQTQNDSLKEKVQCPLKLADASLPLNLDIAYELYEKLFSQVEPLIKDKKHLIIVPSGPLTSLPFHALVTEKPAAAFPTSAAGYKDVPWLARRHAITVLPSVSSLKALRSIAKPSPAERAFIGFGNPRFSRPGAKPTQVAQAPLRGYADYFRGLEPDIDALSRGLAPLPKTEDELRAIAKTLGVPDSDIILRDAATEAAVKQMSADGRLAKYRVVHFATHGLVAGEVKGLAEPALAFSLPAEPSEEDDGLLTASEVAALKLNADWVVLSACNTAAGDAPGAEALSGLAKAFFYAGTRALLVSHWPVDDAAAASLTAKTIAALQAEPAIGRAEALRRSMMALADEGGRYAHPSFWAPFMLVGEGWAPQPSP